MIHVFEQSRDGVCLAAAVVGNGPEDVGRGQAMSLHRESQTHGGQVVRSRGDL